MDDDRVVPSVVPSPNDDQLTRFLKNRVETLARELTRARAERDEIWEEARQAMESHRFLKEIANRLFSLKEIHEQD